MSDPMTSSRSLSGRDVETVRPSTRDVAGGACPVTARNKSANVVSVGAATMSMSASPWGVLTTTSIPPDNRTVDHRPVASWNFLEKSLKSDAKRADAQHVEVNPHRLIPPGIHDLAAELARPGFSTISRPCR